jgi:hypothetical protein
MSYFFGDSQSYNLYAAHPRKRIFVVAAKEIDGVKINTQEEDKPQPP